ncbi:hypothetical protein ACFX2J_032996 [Malus domestica]
MEMRVALRVTNGVVSVWTTIRRKVISYHCGLHFHLLDASSSSWLIIHHHSSSTSSKLIANQVSRDGVFPFVDKAIFYSNSGAILFYTA